MEYTKVGIIHSLEIYHNDLYDYSVWKDGKCLEDRMTLDEAINFCKEESGYYE